MDNDGSRRSEDKWTDKGDIFEFGLARPDACLGSMYISDAGCGRDTEESQGCFQEFSLNKWLEGDTLH